MRVLLVAEKEGTAIHRLCLQLEKSCPWHVFRIVCVHPKRPSPIQLMQFEMGMQWCDVIDFEYWKTAEMLHSRYEIKKPSLLTHHNPYDLNRSTWNKYQINVVSNSEQQRTIRVPSTRIDLPVDLQYWAYQGIEPENTKDIIMVQNRIEAKKGALPVAQVAKELGLSMVLVGDVSDPLYMEQIMATGAVEFHAKISDDKLRSLYYTTKIHVCNSIDGFESGTLPILEAMACGTPVLTRKVGHVPDLFNGRNMRVRRGQPDDTEDLKLHIQELMANKAMRDDIRAESRHSLRYRNYEIYARKYSILYHQLLQKKDLVTAIIPTISDPEELTKTLAAVMTQTYGPMEIIVVDDSKSTGKNEYFIQEIQEKTEHTIKFYSTAIFDRNGDKLYGLARARNKAIMEAEGKWLWFVDDRMQPDKNALDFFYENRKSGVWLWGIKDGVKKSFVENFSFCNRDDLIKIGAFNEQITQYGGMTQDVRSRWELNKMILQMVLEATAATHRKSKSKFQRNNEIAKSKTQCYKLYG